METVKMAPEVEARRREATAKFHERMAENFRRMGDNLNAEQAESAASLVRRS